MNVHLRCCWCNREAVNVLGGWSVCVAHLQALKERIENDVDVSMSVPLKETKFCDHCGGDLEIRNPKGYCDHLYYPDACDICRLARTGA